MVGEGLTEVLADAEGTSALESCDGAHAAESDGLTETVDAGERATSEVVLVDSGLSDPDPDSTGDADMVWLGRRVTDAETGCEWDAVADTDVDSGWDADDESELDDDGETVGEKATRGEDSLLAVTD